MSFSRFVSPWSSASASQRSLRTLSCSCAKRPSSSSAARACDSARLRSCEFTIQMTMRMRYSRKNATAVVRTKSAVLPTPSSCATFCPTNRPKRGSAYASEMPTSNFVRLCA